MVSCGHFLFKATSLCFFHVYHWLTTVEWRGECMSREWIAWLPYSWLTWYRTFGFCLSPPSAHAFVMETARCTKTKGLVRSETVACAFSSAASTPASMARARRPSVHSTDSMRTIVIGRAFSFLPRMRLESDMLNWYCVESGTSASYYTRPLVNSCQLKFEGVDHCREL